MTILDSLHKHVRGDSRQVDEEIRETRFIEVKHSERPTLVCVITMLLFLLLPENFSWTAPFPIRRESAARRLTKSTRSTRTVSKADLLVFAACLNSVFDTLRIGLAGPNAAYRE